MQCVLRFSWRKESITSSAHLLRLTDTWLRDGACQPSMRISEETEGYMLLDPPGEQDLAVTIVFLETRWPLI